MEDLRDPNMSVDQFLQSVDKAHPDQKAVWSPSWKRHPSEYRYRSIWAICLRLHAIDPSLILIFLGKIIDEKRRGEDFYKTIRLDEPLDVIMDRRLYLSNDEVKTDLNRASSYILQDDISSPLTPVAAVSIDNIAVGVDVSMGNDLSICISDTMSMNKWMLRSTRLKETPFWGAYAQCYYSSVDFDTVFKLDVLLLLFDLGLPLDELSPKQRQIVSDYRKRIKIPLIDCFKGCSDLACLVIEYLGLGYSKLTPHSSAHPSLLNGSSST